MKKKILLIEDNADERLLQKFTLEGAGYMVLESDNGRDGIDLALKESPDLILMDIRLPYKTRGIGVAKLLRKKEKTKTIPIIFVTAYPVFEHTKEIKNLSNTGFFVKSPDTAGFLEYISKFLKDKS